MKERPILFSGPMVRAILERRKTQTRRIVKPDIANFLEDGWGPEERMYETRDGDIVPARTLCPYGVPGDRLWVRETFAEVQPYYGPSDEIPDWVNYKYRADFDDFEADPLQFGPNKWRPSIFMPHAASRILLEITNVRVERLQDITEEDAIAEGVEPVEWGEDMGGMPGDFTSYVEGFKDVWQSINGSEFCMENPWVWVIEFKRI